jgi:hypothetical protein
VLHSYRDCRAIKSLPDREPRRPDGRAGHLRLTVRTAEVASAATTDPPYALPYMQANSFLVRAEAALKETLRLQADRSKMLAECDHLKDELRQVAAECVALTARRAATSEVEVLLCDEGAAV